MVTAQEPQRPVDPYAATESLRAALDQVGIVLPSLAVEHASPDLNLVELGRVRADVALKLAEAIRRGNNSAASVATAGEGAL